MMIIALSFFSSLATNAMEISTPGAVAANLLPNGQLFMAYGNKNIEVFDASTGKRISIIQGTEKVFLIGNKGENIWGLASKDKSNWTVFKLSADKKLILDSFVVPQTGSGIVFELIVLDENNIALVQLGDSVSPLLQVISTKNKKNSEAIGPFTTQIVGRLGYYQDEENLYLPGGYPGVVVNFKFSAVNNLKIESKYYFEDWLHDIKKIGDKRFVAAGSLYGVRLFDLGKPLESNGKVKTTDVLDTINAHLFVSKDMVYATSLNKMEVIDLKNNSVKSTTIKMIDGDSKLLIPVGKNLNLDLVIFEPNAGFHTVVLD